MKLIFYLIFYGLMKEVHEGDIAVMDVFMVMT